MHPLKLKASESARFLRSRFDTPPQVGLLAGTGLGPLGDALQRASAIPYAEIPHFPAATVPSHAGRMLSGTLAGRSVAVLQGRFHLYEGYSAAEVGFPVRVLRELGVEHLLITNAAGGLRPGVQPGDLMVITDHINLTGENLLAGPNEDSWGPRFPDMTAAYDPALRRAALDAARRLGLRAHAGVYAGLKGPSMETPAETRYLRIVGADAVGFSTVQETIAAVHAGMRVLGVSVLTNVNDPDRPQPAPLEEIIAVANRAAPGLAGLIAEVVGGLA